MTSRPSLHLISGMSTALECLREMRPTKEEMSSQRILYGIAVTSIGTVSLFLNALLLIVILCTGAIDRLIRFYLLSATLAGLVAVVPILSALSPAILLDAHLNDPTNVIISTTDTLGYLSLMMTTTAIAFDRFVFFLLPRVSVKSATVLNSIRPLKDFRIFSVRCFSLNLNSFFTAIFCRF